MKIPKLIPALAIFALTVATPCRLAAAVQETVSSFGLSISGPTRGGLAQSSDGYYWGTTSGGGATGDGAIFKISAAGEWRTVLTFKNTGPDNYGRGPRAGLVDDGAGFMWGSTAAGGTSGFGTIFKVNAATGVLTTIHHCTNFLPNRGTAPSSTLVHDGLGFLWGTMAEGGNNSNGTLFKINIASGTFVPVAEFTGNSGAVKGKSPYAGLVSDGGGQLWGVTQLGGASGGGTIYKVSASTGAVTTVVEFGTSDGAIKGNYPSGEMMWDPAGFLWGTTANGGASGKGTLFKLNASTGQLQTVVEFTGTSSGAKGESPSSRLETDGSGFIWGTTPRGGSLFGTGTVFKLNMATGAFTTVIEFPETDGAVIGKSPGAGLTYLPGGFLLGTTGGGGGDPSNYGPGTVFKINAALGQLTTLAQFTDAGSNDLGSAPHSGVTEGSGGFLWGATREGGRMGMGTIYKVDPVTRVRTTLAEFTGRTGSTLGRIASSTLRRDDQGNFWGTTQFGGTNDQGTLFKIAEATGEFTSVVRFGDGGNGKGINPLGSVLIDSSGILWGMTSGGGTSGRGTIYRFNPATTTLEAVVQFSGNGASNKGSGPVGSLYDDGAGFLWGTTYSGGSTDFGTVFKMAKSGFVLTTVVTFTGGTGAFVGANPGGGLIDDGAGFLWGTTSGGNVSFTSSLGTVFKIAKATGAFTNVVAFTGNGAANKGRGPLGSLTSDGLGSLWGVTEAGGLSDSGTVFRIPTASGQLITVANFESVGKAPRFVDLVKLSDGNLYGTASTGGPGGAGSVFRIRQGPTPVTQAATSVLATTATLNGSVNPNGMTTSVRFEYGTDPSLAGASFIGAPVSANGSLPITYNRPIAGLLPKTKYYFRITGLNAENAVRQNGETLSFTTLGNDAALSGLTFSGLLPTFNPETSSYVATLSSRTPSASLTATVRDSGAKMKIAGVDRPSGQSVTFNFNTGNTVIPVVVTAEDGETTRTYTLSVTRLPETFTLLPSNVPPLAAEGFAATGHDIRISLAGAPVPGQTLRVIDNTALAFITGRFGNLAHGQEIVLNFGGKSYAYVANYHGGSGNDLTLHWKSTDLASWGDNEYGQLGNGKLTDGLVPARITRKEVLAGKTILSVSNGLFHSLALGSDGTVAAWGDGYQGKLGYGDTLYRPYPVAVNTSGVLAGKTVIAISGGTDHSLALCSDGTIAAWGDNTYGQLGDNRASGAFSSVPVAVNRSGVLAGKQVVGISCGPFNNLALCSDGTLVTWGDNRAGQSGNGSTVPNNPVPVTVQQSGVLLDKRVVAISAGRHCLALCSDGAIASWGFNEYGQLGNNSLTDSNVPVLVRVAGALIRRTPVAVVAGGLHSLALCSDGSAAAWGANNVGQVGDGTVSSSPPQARLTPVSVSTAGALAGKTVTHLDAGWCHSIATLSDGTLATWGWNADGELGDNSTTNSPVPIPVSMAQLPAGSRFIDVAPGSSRFALAILALQPPSATTLAATPVRARSATLRGQVASNGIATAVTFEWGETTAYGHSLPAIPATVAADAPETEVAALVDSLRPSATYHFRVRAENEAGVTYGADMVFTTPNDNAFAAWILTGPVSLLPDFAPSVFDYSVTVPFDTTSIPVSVVTQDPPATATVDGSSASSPVTVELPVGTKTIEVVVTAEDRETTRTYRVHVSRLPAVFVYSTGNEVPLSTPRFVAPAVPVSFALNYAPSPGTVLTVARSTGLEFVSGRFSNLAHGQLVTLTHGGISYRFIANYHGGSGNDLVLQWADTQLHGWGSNANGQLAAADGTKNPWLAPAPIPGMAGASLMATATGYLHTLALSADGTVSSWGHNAYGQLGDGTKLSRPTPAPITTGALAGKRVIALAAGAFHSLALCEDGTVASWGYNNHGQLGNGSTATSTVPIAVNATGSLAGKTVVSISAGAYHSLVLCSDGSVHAWGFNGTGALGNNATVNSLVPVQSLSESGNLRAVAISAGQYHNLAIRDDGAVVAWGYNSQGQLGRGDTVQQNRATPVSFAGGMAGKSARAVAAGGSHSTVLFDDGTLAAWGLGASGQLGNGTTVTSFSPVALQMNGALSGKSINALAAGDAYSFVACSDGSLVAWGENGSGQLGLGSTTSSAVPVAVAGASPFMGASTGSSSQHILAPLALPAVSGPNPVAGGSSVPGTLTEWRTVHFGQSGNAGVAADLGDPDHDGVANLIEFAFGLDPQQPDVTLLPASTVVGNYLVIEFTERPGLEGVTFGASATSNFRDWNSVPDEGVKPHHRFRLPIGGKSGFMRLEVTTP